MCGILPSLWKTSPNLMSEIFLTSCYIDINIQRVGLTVNKSFLAPDTE